MRTLAEVDSDLKTLEGKHADLRDEVARRDGNLRAEIKAMGTAIDEHIKLLAGETRAQSAMLSKLVRWQNSPWLKSAVVTGAVVGGAIGGFLAAKGGH
jgi:hypothetical protein